MNQRQPPRPELAATNETAPTSPSTADIQHDAQWEATHGAASTASPHDAAILRYRNQRIVLSGRILSQILWLAAHGSTINGVAAESGQLWLTWKGGSIAGEIRTRL